MATFVTNERTLPLLLQKRSDLLNLEASITQPILDDFCRWVKCSGPQYAVDRMKIIKQVILNYVSSGAEIPKGLWIRKRNRFLLAGQYGKLQQLACQSDHMLKKVLTFCNMYTALSEKETSPADVLKFRLGVETPGPEVSELILEGMARATVHMVKFFGLRHDDVLYSGPYEQTGYQKPHQEAEFMDSVERLFRTDIGTKLIQRPSVFTPLMNVLGFRGYRFARTPAYMGKVFRIPNPGLKSRWVCDFNKALDHCLKPLGKRVYDLVAQLPWDITFDEGKCFSPIQRALAENRTAYAFDLSSATDRFPWSIQKQVLTFLAQGEKWDELVDLYDFVLHLPAVMPDGSEIRWVQGQPLGAFPSFATFTLTHGILLYLLNGCKYAEEFFVHGDDVVILDDALASKYKSMLKQLGVDISEFKTLKSSTMTEINAHLITRKHVLTIPKWKPITKSNLFGQIKTWGTGVLKYARLNPESRRIVLKIASLPVSLGGAGVNPLGIPLLERMSGLEDLLFKEKELSYESSTRTKVLKRYLANPRFVNLLGNALREAGHSDQERLQEYKDNGLPSIFGDSNDLDILGKNLYSVNTDVKIPIYSSQTDTKPLDEVELLVSKAKKSFRFHSE